MSLKREIEDLIEKLPKYKKIPVKDQTDWLLVYGLSDLYKAGVFQTENKNEITLQRKKCGRSRYFHYPRSELR